MSFFKCCSCKGSGGVLEQTEDPYSEDEDEGRRNRMEGGDQGEGSHGRYGGEGDQDTYLGDKDDTLSLATSNEDGTLYLGDGGSIDGEEAGHLRQVSLGTRLRRQSWALGQRSILPFVIHNITVCFALQSFEQITVRYFQFCFLLYSRKFTFDSTTV